MSMDFEWDKLGMHGRTNRSERRWGERRQRPGSAYGMKGDLRGVGQTGQCSGAGQ